MFAGMMVMVRWQLTGSRAYCSFAYVEATSRTYWHCSQTFVVSKLSHSLQHIVLLLNSCPAMVLVLSSEPIKNLLLRLSASVLCWWNCHDPDWCWKKEGCHRTVLRIPLATANLLVMPLVAVAKFSTLSLVSTEMGDNLSLYHRSQVKSMMLTDALNLYVCIVLQILMLILLFSNFQCRTQINLRYR